MSMNVNDLTYQTIQQRVQQVSPLPVDTVAKNKNLCWAWAINLTERVKKYKNNFLNSE